MPFIALLGRLFASRLGHWITSALLFIGISFGVQNFATEPLLAYISQQFSGLPSDAVAWLGFTNFDRALTIIFSAYSVRMASGFVLRRRV